MKTVWKVPLEAWNTTVSAVEGAKPLCVQMQFGAPCLWLEVESTNPKKEFPLLILGTGHRMPEGSWNYVGTFQTEAGGIPLVFHVYLGE